MLELNGTPEVFFSIDAILKNFKIIADLHHTALKKGRKFTGDEKKILVKEILDFNFNILDFFCKLQKSVFNTKKVNKQLSLGGDDLIPTVQHEFVIYYLLQEQGMQQEIDIIIQNIDDYIGIVNNYEKKYEAKIYQKKFDRKPNTLTPLEDVQEDIAIFLQNQFQAQNVKVLLSVDYTLSILQSGMMLVCPNGNDALKNIFSKIKIPIEYSSQLEDRVYTAIMLYMSLMYPKLQLVTCSSPERDRILEDRLVELILQVGENDPDKIRFMIDDVERIERFLRISLEQYRFIEKKLQNDLELLLNTVPFSDKKDLFQSISYLADIIKTGVVRIKSIQILKAVSQIKSPLIFSQNQHREEPHQKNTDLSNSNELKLVNYPKLLIKRSFTR